MIDDIGWSLLARYVAGETTLAESAEIERWIRADAERERAYAELIRIWRAPPAVVPDVEQAWAGVVARTSEPTDQALPHRPVRSASRLRPGRTPWGWLRAAAVLAVVVGGSLLAHDQWKRTRGAPAARVDREFVTGYGEQRTIDLDDGTRVVVNVGSRLRVPASYGARARTVELSGEAYFAVAPDPEQPFTVRSGRAEVHVLGTEFGVRAYPHEPSARVVVAGGRVAVRAINDSAGEESVLIRGDLADVSDDGRGVQVRRVDPDRYLAWLAGRIVFDNMPLKDVVEQLALEYGRNFAVHDPALADLPLTTAFDRGQPLNEVLDIISLSLQARYEVVDGTITFLPTQ